jgi:hypothetical protein
VIVTLVQPNHIGAKWTQENKHFRSSVWSYDGTLISASFPKFVNWGENPQEFPVPQSLNKCTILDKLDGSLLIVSKYKGNFILRTRGTVDASSMDNGHELQIFRDTILPKLEIDIFNKNSKVSQDTWNVSYLFEWTTPENKIVIRYTEVEFRLIGIVNHDHYTLWTQSSLDFLAKELELLRPETYKFTTVTDLLSSVEKWSGKEGVVVYSHQDQMLHKVKSASYLALHRMKSEFSNIEAVIDVWLEQNRPNYTDFYNYILNVADFETAEDVKGFISNICDANKQVNSIIQGMSDFVTNKVKLLPTRKEQALLITSAYGITNRSGYVFKNLDNKPLDKEDIKKLLFQCLKR